MVKNSSPIEKISKRKSFSPTINVKRVKYKKGYYVRVSVDSQYKFREKWSRKNTLDVVRKKIDNKEDGFIIKKDFNRYGIKVIRRTENLVYKRRKTQPRNINYVRGVGVVSAEIEYKGRTSHVNIEVSSYAVKIVNGKMYKRLTNSFVTKKDIFKRMKRQAIEKILQNNEEKGINLRTDSFINVSDPKNFYWEVIREN